MKFSHFQRTVVVICSVLTVFTLLSSDLAQAYNSEEHKLLADNGASRVLVPSSVTLPRSVGFRTLTPSEYIIDFTRAKKLATGFASNNKSDYDRSAKAQDNYYWTGFGHHKYNMNIWIPPANLAPKKVLLIPAIIGDRPTYMTFGELVSFYGDYRRTVAPRQSHGACNLTHANVNTMKFERGTGRYSHLAPDPMPADMYIKSMASGVVPPYGVAGSGLVYTAKKVTDYNEAGWWGDEAMRIASVNDWHFSNAAAAWYVGAHRMALYYAEKAKTNPNYWVTALHHEATALHSLTDLFAFGHVVIRREKTSYAINKFSGVLDTPTFKWMEHLLRVGGGFRQESGVLNLSAALPPVSATTAPRNAFLKWNAIPWALVGRTENQLHDRFNESGAIVRNLNGNKFRIFGDFKAKESSAKTRAVVIHCVRESLQQLFDGYKALASGESTLQKYTRPGSKFYAALDYVPIYIDSDPDGLFTGLFTPYAGFIDRVSGKNKLKKEWVNCMVPYIDGKSKLPPKRTKKCSEFEIPVTEIQQPSDVPLSGNVNADFGLGGVTPASSSGSQPEIKINTATPTGGSLQLGGTSQSGSGTNSAAGSQGATAIPIDGQWSLTAHNQYSKEKLSKLAWRSISIKQNGDQVSGYVATAGLNGGRLFIGKRQGNPFKVRINTAAGSEAFGMILEGNLKVLNKSTIQLSFRNSVYTWKKGAGTFVDSFKQTGGRTKQPVTRTMPAVSKPLSQPKPVSSTNQAARAKLLARKQELLDRIAKLKTGSYIVSYPRVNQPKLITVAEFRQKRIAMNGGSTRYVEQSVQRALKRNTYLIQQMTFKIKMIDKELSHLK